MSIPRPPLPSRPDPVLRQGRPLHVPPGPTSHSPEPAGAPLVAPLRASPATSPSAALSSLAGTKWAPRESVRHRGQALAGAHREECPQGGEEKAEPGDGDRKEHGHRDRPLLQLRPSRLLPAGEDPQAPSHRGKPRHSGCSSLPQAAQRGWRGRTMTSLPSWSLQRGHGHIWAQRRGGDTPEAGTPSQAEDLQEGWPPAVCPCLSCRPRASTMGTLSAAGSIQALCAENEDSAPPSPHFLVRGRIQPLLPSL